MNTVMIRYVTGQNSEIYKGECQNLVFLISFRFVNMHTSNKINNDIIEIFSGDSRMKIYSHPELSLYRGLLLYDYSAFNWFHLITRIEQCV